MCAYAFMYFFCVQACVESNFPIPSPLPLSLFGTASHRYWTGQGLYCSVNHTGLASLALHTEALRKKRMKESNQCKNISISVRVLRCVLVLVWQCLGKPKCFDILDLKLAGTYSISQTVTRFSLTTWALQPDLLKWAECKGWWAHTQALLYGSWKLYFCPEDPKFKTNMSCGTFVTMIPLYL